MSQDQSPPTCLTNLSGTRDLAHTERVLAPGTFKYKRNGRDGHGYRHGGEKEKGSSERGSMKILEAEGTAAYTRRPGTNSITAVSAHTRPVSSANTASTSAVSASERRLPILDLSRYARLPAIHSWTSSFWVLTIYSTVKLSALPCNGM